MLGSSILLIGASSSCHLSPQALGSSGFNRLPGGSVNATSGLNKAILGPRLVRVHAKVEIQAGLERPRIDRLRVEERQQKMPVLRLLGSR
jgi:hypothetical protein